MRNKKRLIFGIFLIGIFLISFVNSADSAVFSNSASLGSPAFNADSSFVGSTSNWQYTSPTYSAYYSSDQIRTYWPILDAMNNGSCNAGTDFLVMIPPGGCSPAVVRSDLLEDQNVPVFCQLSAVRVNPLIKVSSIRSISFKGKYAENVVGVSFHPARAAVRTYQTLLGDPLMNNIGYVVLVLKRTKAEKDMPKWIEGNLTATIYYDAEKAFGVGQSEFYLPLISDEQWQSEYKNYGFWYGKGFARVEAIEGDRATIGLYTDKDNLFRRVTLKVGEKSSEFYFPGFYCKAALQVQLNSFVSDDKQAKLIINGQEVWVIPGSKIIDSKCTVSSINTIDDGTGTVDIRCPSGSFSLALQKNSLTFNIGDSEKSARVGDVLSSTTIDSKTTNLFVAYTGKLPSNVYQSGPKGKDTDFKNSLGGKDFVILTSSDTKVIDITKEGSEVSKLISDNTRTNVAIDELKKKISSTGRTLLLVGESVSNSNPSIKFNGWQTTKQISDKANVNIESSTKDTVNKYFNSASDALVQLLDNYPTEKSVQVSNSILIPTFGEKALFEQIGLARKTRNFNEAENLISKFEQTYPDSGLLNQAKQTLMPGVDYSLSARTVIINNNYYNIQVQNFKPTNKDKKKVSVSVANSPAEYTEGDRINIRSATSTDRAYSYLIVDKITKNLVTFTFYSYTEKQGIKSESLGSYSEGQERIVDGKRVYINLITTEELASISIIPRVDYTKTEANFTFKIGIEKRDIKLSPEKTEDMIANLNKSIADWEKINEKLANLIKGWKGACFATSAALMVKNFASGLSGESLARSDVMKVYKEKCSTLVSQKKFVSLSECYAGLSSDINKDVDARTQQIKNVNSIVTGIESRSIESKGSLLEGDTINQNKQLKELRDAVIVKRGNTITINKNGQEKSVEVNSITDTDVLKLLLEDDSGFTDTMKESRKTYLNSALSPVYDLQEAQKSLKQSEDQLKGLIGSGSSVSVMSLADEKTKVGEWGGNTVGSLGDGSSLKANLINAGAKNDDRIQFVNYQGNSYVTVLTSTTVASASSAMGAGKIYKITDSTTGTLEEVKASPISKDTVASVDNKVANLLGSYNFVSGGQCSHQYNNAKVRFYDTAPNKGLPGVVPFDLKSGWYAYVSEGIGGIAATTSSSQATYQASGEVRFFYVCNVGANGLEENRKGDDVCQSFDINTYDKVTSFRGCPTMQSSAVKALAEKAQEAIRQAAQQYGKSTVRIFGQDIPVSAPMGGENEFNCEDFMSPSDCRILYNVCDPVICPASRCNFGGKWPVANVVQSGIIGSIVLCLPNFPQVLVPVCLTGINAGIDSFISIMKSHRDCLAKSLKTGEKVGICDEIYSIYLCEFFWRQFAPLMNVAIPKLISSAYGQTAPQGGAEYLTVMKSWDNLQQSIDYFKNNYAQNAFKAFEFKNVEEVGGEFCKAFVGTSLPTSAKALDNLLEPESPPQYYANFNEIAYTGATIPATSQYKVYYHIFSGKDKGVYYSVYLRSPPASSYYKSAAEIPVKTGYIAKGESADESIDFTAPAGYKELCVMIDAQQYCGFKQVQSDAFLDYVQAKYRTSEATKAGVKTEKECISGSPSLLALVNPNLQAGAEEMINPEIALRGVTRICANSNPTLSVDSTIANSVSTKTITVTSPAADTTSSATTTPATSTSTSNARWIDVGYCGDTKLRCWLDMNSVKSDITRVSAVDNTSISSVGKYVQDNIVNTNNILRGDAAQLELDKVKASILDKLGNLDSSVNDQKANTADVKVSSLKADLTAAKISSSSIIGVIDKALIYTEKDGATKMITTKLDELAGLSSDPNVAVIDGSSNALKAEAVWMKIRVYQIITSSLWDTLVAPSDPKVSADTTKKIIADSNPGSIISTSTEPSLEDIVSVTFDGKVKIRDAINLDVAGCNLADLRKLNPSSVISSAEYVPSKGIKISTPYKCSSSSYI